MSVVHTAVPGAGARASAHDSPDHSAQAFDPYIPATTTMRELTVLPVVVGTVPSLAFAVGVYLPFSSTSPIFIGGLVRWRGDMYVRRKQAGTALTEAQLMAEGDKSPGVLLASGYIAGGADVFSMIPFALLIVLLHLVGREAVLRPKVPGRQP